MKDRLLKLLEENWELYLPELHKLMPEIDGEYAIYMPVKPKYNPNILLCGNVSTEFIDVFNQLTLEKIITLVPHSIQEILLDSKCIYSNIPLISKKDMKSKKECWLPVSIVKITKKVLENEKT